MTPRTRNAPAPTLGVRALNRATLARQLLLRRAALGAEEAVARLVGLQAQNTRPPYHALAARLDGFRPEELSELMERRAVARIVTLRSTLHTHTADDVLSLRPLVQPARERELNAFRARLTGVDRDRLARTARELVEERPRTPAELRGHLAPLWPDADPAALSVAARCLLPLVQVTPRGLWERSGQVALTTAEHWLGRPAGEPAAPETAVRRYLAVFGPASVKDMQTWAGLTRLRPVFEALRPELAVFRDEHGTELFDLPDAPRPDADEDAPPRLLPEFDNLLLSHADRTRVVPPAYKDRTWRVNQSFPAFLLDGFVAGVWKLERPTGKADRAAVVLEPFGAPTRAQRTALVEEAGRTLEVLAAADPDVRFGAVIG
ncbi:winged helix DNA-binding domain-containing protein [Streptomyces sp. ODS05-4]|uniref:winged helix DNA-binding domain-containing protein n=1 Tax=Streptomyces sp. ODS05-4 TaxID=2944939 RepID=UPI00210B1E55|nr:winged helix DNA-binding domain-containing protein [Streptomyces sp. ODS05-4]